MPEFIINYIKEGAIKIDATDVEEAKEIFNELKHSEDLPGDITINDIYTVDFVDDIPILKRIKPPRSR